MASDVNANVSTSMYCHACGAANPPQSTHCHACGEPLSALKGGTGRTTNPLTGLLLPDVIIQQRYRILEVLSTGEVSTFYKAEDIQFGNRVVALKEIGQNRQSTQDASELIEASKREMLSLAGVIHPNLPRVYDYFVENGRWYFVMDFLEGETLEAYMTKRKNQPISVEEVLDSGIQLATVFEYLHLHQPPLGLRELTLHNIWRTPDGRLYLLDTEIASLADSMSERESVSRLGVVLQQLQAGKKPVHTLTHVALPKLHKRSRQAQSYSLKSLIQQIVQQDGSKKLYTMRMVKQELQQQELQLLATQQTSTLTQKQRRFPRRKFIKGLAGIAGIAAASGTLAWLGESTYFGIPNPGYSSSPGGTICTYYTGSGVLGVAWSPNGMRLVMGNNKARVQAFDASTGLHTINFQAPGLIQAAIEAVIWLPDGSAIAAGGDDNVVWVWNAVTGRLQRTYSGHTDMVITLASSPDGRFIASAGKDETVQVWEVDTGRQAVIYRGHTGGIGSVAWSPDGNYIASASFDSTVQIWEADTGRPVYTYGGHREAVYTVAWSSDGQRIASGDAGGKVQVWPVALFEINGQQQKTVTYYQGNGTTNFGNNAVQAVVWSPDGRYIASASHDVEVWNSRTGKLILAYTKHATSFSTGVQAVVWSPNGRYIASGGLEGSVQVWNAP